MAVRRKEKLKQWEVLRLKASPAAFVGIVYAADKETANRHRDSSNSISGRSINGG
jgi:hypothetical protein